MRRAGGFSVAEALVASLIVTIVLIGVGSLFTALGRQAERQGGRTPSVGGMTDVALDRMERDLQRATDFPERAGRLHADPRTLLLTLTDGKVVAWRQEGSALVRSSEDERGRLRDRKILDGVTLLVMQRRAQVLFDMSVRRRGEPQRMRTVLLRNAGAPASEEEP